MNVPLPITITHKPKNLKIFPFVREAILVLIITT